FSSRRRHTRSYGDWSSDVCSSDLIVTANQIVRDKKDEAIEQPLTVPAAVPPVPVPVVKAIEKEVEQVTPKAIKPEVIQPEPIREIGRASCRERVEIWVGARE